VRYLTSTPEGRVGAASRVPVDADLKDTGKILQGGRSARWTSPRPVAVLFHRGSLSPGSPEADEYRCGFMGEMLDATRRGAATWR